MADSCSLSMVFPTPQYDPITSVDCTLSLGTPSTRQSCNDTIKRSGNNNSNFFMSNLCCGAAAFQTKKTTSTSPSSTAPLPQPAAPHKTTMAAVNGEPLLPRRCANCDTTSTPLWRNGPRGPKSLCNACGIRFKKEERRAITINGTTTGNAAAAAATKEQPHLMDHHAWAHHGQHNEFRFMDSETTTGVPFLSWRLNVPDRTSSLVHDYSY
ncbi:hypothetical protein ACHQM5_016413 [Ranunculus cassubicifolius]